MLSAPNLRIPASRSIMFETAPVQSFIYTWSWLLYVLHVSCTVMFLGLPLFLALPLYRLYLHPLARAAGPRLAAISSCWYAYQVRNGRMLRLSKQLHKQYGPVVRVSPNELWFASKDAFKIIYSPTNGFEKSDFYLATALLKPKLTWEGWHLRLTSPDTLDLLAESDMKRYRLQRRLIGPVYNANNVKQYEPSVDAVLARVIHQICALDGAEVDLKEWMHITVVECLGAVSLSNWSPGYLDAKSDGASGKHAYMGWRRKSVFGLFPAAVILESLSRSAGRAFANFWGLTYYTPKEGFKPFFPDVQKRITRRVRVALQGRLRKDARKDIVADLIQLTEDRPEFNEKYLRRMAISNFGAGHETLTSTLISAFAMIGSHAHCQTRIAKEVRQTSGSLSYDDACQLHFTQASIKEAQRLHPVIGMSLSRKVPVGGMEVHGVSIPAGTVVGCNPVSLHRDPAIFGEDAEAYRPDRWLDETTRKDLDRYNLIYGGGARTCPGRYLAEMLVGKIVPTLMRHFDVEVSIPPEDQMPYYFMAMLTGVKARFVARGHMAAEAQV